MLKMRDVLIWTLRKIEPFEKEAIERATSLFIEAFGSGYIDAADITECAGVAVALGAYCREELIACLLLEGWTSQYAEYFNQFLPSARQFPLNKNEEYTGNPVVQLCQLVVEPEYRGYGIGTRLVQEAIDKFADHKLFFAIARERPVPFPQGSLGLLRRLGFEELSVVNEFYKNDDEHTCICCGDPCKCKAHLVLYRRG